MKTILSALGLSLLIFTSCGGQKKVEVDFIQDNIDNAVAQNTIQTDIIEKSGKILNPRTINADGSISYIPIDDWCSGFFPGSMWLTYNLTGDKKWLPLAEKYTEALDSVKYLKWHHDVGFMIGCSYLNGYRFADKKEYKDVIVEAAKSPKYPEVPYLPSRFPSLLFCFSSQKFFRNSSDILPQRSSPQEPQSQSDFS